MLYKKDKECTLFRDYNGKKYTPLNLYKGNKKIAGWKEQLFNATLVSQNDTYNDSAFLKIYGKSEQIITSDGQGKNKFDKTKYANLEDFIGTTSYKYATIQLKPNTTYKLSINRKNGYTGVVPGKYLLIGTTSSVNYQWSSIMHPASPNTNVSPYTTSSNGLLYIGYLNNGFTQSDLDTCWDNTDVQIEEGTVATDFEEYIHNSPSPNYPSEISSVKDFDLISTDGVEQIQTVNFPYILRSLPDGTKDYIEIDNVNKTTKLYRNVGTKTFVGTEVWIHSENYNNLSRFFSFVTGNKTGKSNSNINVISANFVGKSWDTKYINLVNNVHTYSGDNRIGLFIDNSLTGILAGDDNPTRIIKIKSWIVNNNFSVQYELATPLITDLNYNEVLTYYPYTQIYTNATIQPTLDGKVRIIDHGS